MKIGSWNLLHGMAIPQGGTSAESLLSAAVFTGTFNAHEPVAEHGLEHNRVDSHFSVHALRVGRQNIPCELGRTVANGILESAEGKLPAFGAE
jgi:hypothetical protein